MAARGDPPSALSFPLVPLERSACFSRKPQAFSRKRKNFRTVCTARTERGLLPNGVAGLVGSRDTQCCGPSCGFSSPSPHSPFFCSSLVRPQAGNQRILMNSSFLPRSWKSECPAQKCIAPSKFLQTLKSWENGRIWLQGAARCKHSILDEKYLLSTAQSGRINMWVSIDLRFVFIPLCLTSIYPYFSSTNV